MSRACDYMRKYSGCRGAVYIRDSRSSRWEIKRSTRFFNFIPFFFEGIDLLLQRIILFGRCGPFLKILFQLLNRFFALIRFLLKRFIF